MRRVSLAIVLWCSSCAATLIAAAGLSGLFAGWQAIHVYAISGPGKIGSDSLPGSRSRQSRPIPSRNPGGKLARLTEQSKPAWVTKRWVIDAPRVRQISFCAMAPLISDRDRRPHCRWMRSWREYAQENILASPTGQLVATDLLSSAR